MLEVALCLPLFFILILGTAEIASVAWSAIQVQNAARAGAQFGSQSRAAAADATDISTAAKNDAPKLTRMTVTSSQTCKCINTSSGATAGTGCTLISQCPSPFVIMDYVQVNTSSAVTPLVHLPGLPASYTLTGQAILGVVK
jgi:Flp pilus assembly protein TadG